MRRKEMRRKRMLLKLNNRFDNWPELHRGERDLIANYTNLKLPS